MLECRRWCTAFVVDPLQRRSLIQIQAGGFGGAPKTKLRKKEQSNTCPCGSGFHYAGCCKPYHDGLQVVPTAEALLRARFSAFARKQVDFIIGTTYITNRQDDEKKWRTKLAKGLDSTRFTSLRIVEEMKDDHPFTSIVFEAGMQPLSQRGQGAKAIVFTEKAKFILDEDLEPPTWF
mmetsp:Transcript_6347/g.8931  ORF Transcript_6347/g.8931 Transcript_6347/m.8931 type:complete len:177 (-) Transcript_6347:145-675(-)